MVGHDDGGRLEALPLSDPPPPLALGVGFRVSGSQVPGFGFRVSLKLPPFPKLIKVFGVETVVRAVVASSSILASKHPSLCTTWNPTLL